MSQNSNCTCGCKPSKPVTIPISKISLPTCGVELTIDGADLPGPITGGRIRVTEDLHIYIDGKRTESGDGLTPETAVMSYEEALDVASLYDGCNRYDLHVHFMDLPEGETYPEIWVHSGHHATFSQMSISGESWERTRLQMLRVTGTFVVASNITAGRFVSDGILWIEGDIGVMPRETPMGAISTGNSNSLRVLSGCTLHVEGGAYQRMFEAFNGHLLVQQEVRIVHEGPVSITTAYVEAWDGGVVSFLATVTISGTAVGKRYTVHDGGLISTRGKDQEFFPGSVAGTTQTGGAYY